MKSGEGPSAREQYPPRKSASLDLLCATPHYIVERLKREQALRWCPALRGRVLDVGCGFSPYRKFLTNITSYTGIEAELRYLPDIVASSLALPLPDESVDAAVMTEVLEHLPEPLDALRELSRVLRPGGRIYVTVPMTWGLHYEPNDYYRFTGWGVAHLLERTGFELEVIEPFGGLFSIISARLADLANGALVEPMLRLVRLRRGQLRIGAAVLAGFNLPAFYASRALDRMWTRDVLGWAVMARRR